MKISIKSVLPTIAFATIVGLQGFVIHQQNQANQSLEAQVQTLQTQIKNVNASNSELLSKIEKIESDLETKPRMLLSRN